MAYEVVNSQVKYKGRIIDVVEDEITLPDGRTALREVVVRGKAAAVVAVDDNNKVAIIKQYRHGAKAMILEIPAGMVDQGEDTLTCAVRELEEETGLIAKKMEKLLDLHVSVGFCTEVITIYLGTDLKEGKTNFDADEFIETDKYSFDEIIGLIMSGNITDSKTISGIFAAKEKLGL